MAARSNYVGQARRAAPKRPNFIPSTPNYFKYQWRDRDPDMDLIVGLIGDSGLSPEDIEQETAALGWRVSKYTIIGWLYGSVRRPQNYTMTIVAMALGWTKTWGPVSQPSTSTTSSRAAASPEKRTYAHH